MISLLSITLPIFLLIGLGFAAARIGAVSGRFIDDFGQFVLNFALPALVFHALLSQDLRQTFDATYVFVYGSSSLAVFVIVLTLFRFVLGRSLAHAAIASLGGAAANSGFIGFPVATLAFGAPALTALPLSMLVEVVLIIPLALGLAEAGRTGGRSPGAIALDAILRLARMPLMVAIVVGIVLSILGVGLPAPVDTAVGMLSSASAASALFVVGGTLAGVSADSFSADLAWISVAKLILHPLFVALGFYALGGVSTELMVLGIVFASAPMITTYPIFGQRFGLGPVAAATLLVGTAASFVTMTAVLALVGARTEPAALTDISTAYHIERALGSADHGD